MKQCATCNVSLFDSCNSCGICGKDDLIQTKATIERKKQHPEAKLRDISSDLHKINNYDNIMILGTHGSGKTTMAQTIKWLVENRKGIGCMIFDENSQMVRQNNFKSKQTLKMIVNNRHEGIKNIMTAQNIKSFPMSMRTMSGNNLIIFTSMSDEMRKANTTEYRPIIDDFKYYSDENFRDPETGHKKYLAMAQHEAWIGTYGSNK